MQQGGWRLEYSHAVAERPVPAIEPDGGPLLAVAHWLTVATVALLPLFMGGNRPLFWSAAGILLGAAGLLFGAAIAFAGLRPDRRLLLPALGFGMVAGWIALQTVPGPPSGLVHPVWPAAAEVLGRPLVGSISAQPMGGLDALIRWLSFGVAFAVLAHSCRDAARARRTLTALVAVGAVTSAAAVVVHLSAPELVSGIEKWAYFDLAIGPFVNPNTFATYLGLLALAALSGLLTFDAEAAMTMGAARGGQGAVSYRVALASMLAIVLLALLMTGSRAGMAAMAAGAVVVLMTYIARAGENSRVTGPVALLAGVVLMAGLAVVLADTLSGEGETGNDLVFRTGLFGGALAAIADRPLLGHGAGAFPEVFARYLPESVDLLRYRQAHNA